LRESFEYDYREIAGIVGRNEANCRKILSRVREKLHRGEPAASVQSVMFLI
jgi:RNA polymerase sigma-70 factor (ECF subfamily)